MSVEDWLAVMFAVVNLATPVVTAFITAYSLWHQWRDCDEFEHRLKARNKLLEYLIHGLPGEE